MTVVVCVDMYMNTYVDMYVDMNTGVDDTVSVCGDGDVNDNAYADVSVYMNIVVYVDADIVRVCE